MPDEPPISNWKNAIVFHGTNTSGAKSITKEIRVPETGGYFGNAFYAACHNEAAHHTWAQDAAASNGGKPVVLAFRIGRHARILDMRNEQDCDSMMQLQGNLQISDPEFHKKMASRGVDGVFDRSIMGVAIFNPTVLELLGKTSPTGEITPKKVPEHPALQYAAKIATERAQLGEADSIHGTKHWARVERNALYIASKSNADPLVVAIFARLHDCCREHDGYDEEHGHRAAEFFLEDQTFKRWLTKTQIKKAATAMSIHTTATYGDEDPTIGACLDADRLDLVRLGMDVEEEYLSTEAAKSVIAEFSSREIYNGEFCEGMQLPGRSSETGSQKKAKRQSLAHS